MEKKADDIKGLRDLAHMYIKSQPPAPLPMGSFSTANLSQGSDPPSVATGETWRIQPLEERTRSKEASGHGKPSRRLCLYPAPGCRLGRCNQQKIGTSSQFSMNGGGCKWVQIRAAFWLLYAVPENGSSACWPRISEGLNHFNHV